MSKNLILRTAAVLLIGTGAAFAQTTAPAPTTAPKAGTTAPAPTTAPKAVTPAPAPAAPKAAAPAPAPVAAPKAAPAPVAAPAATAPKAAPAPAPAAAATVVNLNTATEAELDKLPQIGPARAKAIIEARAKGKFKNWDDFVARNVVPKNAEDAIKAQVKF